MLKPNGRVILHVLHADRTEMVNQLFTTAAYLGIPRHEIRSATEGFNVPRAVAAWLFPSLYPDQED